MEDYPFILIDEQAGSVKLSVATTSPDDDELVGTYQATLLIHLPEWPDNPFSVSHAFQVTLEPSQIGSPFFDPDLILAVVLIKEPEPWEYEIPPAFTPNPNSEVFLQVATNSDFI